MVLVLAFGMFAIILFESGIYKALSFALILIAIAAVGYRDIVKTGKNKTGDLEINNK